MKVTAWPKTDGLTDEASRRRGRRLVDRLADGGRGAAGEVGVAAVDRRDRVRCPAPSAEVVKVAWPAGVERRRCPASLPPSMKVTVPAGRAGRPGAATVTVAVKVTDWPKTDGLADDASVVVVVAWLTVWLRAVEVLPPKLVSPL